MIFALAVGFALVQAPQLRAQPSLDFNIASGGTGSVSYAGGTGALIGSDTVGTVEGVFGTPSNNNTTLNITGGSLSFNTGAASGNNPGAWQWVGTSGNFITITGIVASQGTFVGPTSSALLTGTIETASVQVNGGTNKVVLSVFVDTVDATLASYFGLPGGSAPWQGSLNLSFQVAATLGSAFSTTNVGSGDAITNPVPEPSTMAIAGLGALGLIGYGLRRRKSA